MSQVARVSGVSRATVSSILNQRSDFFGSERTRRRVLGAVHSLGYRTNLAARGVAGHGTATIGMINTGSSEITNACFTAFESCARQHHYMALASFNHEEPATEDQLLLWLHDRCVDGMLLVPSEHGGHAELRRLARQGFPIVTFDGHRTGVLCDDVSVDHFHGGQLQAQHLLSLGRKNIAIANSGTSRWIVVEQRMAGVEQVLREAGCAPPPRMDLPLEVHTVAHWTEADFQRVRDFLHAHRGRIDAVAAVGDTLGMIVMGLAIQMGISVPDELAVIGYDGLAMTNNPLLSLSSVRTPNAECGRMAFELMDDRIEGRRTQFKQIKIPPTLVVRSSTVARASGGPVALPAE